MGIRATALAVLAGLLMAGCMTIGRPFPSEPIRGLEIGETTRQQVLDRFGPPWRTGIEDGQDTLTYGHYRYSLFGPPRASDLVLRFDERQKLASYTYSTTGDGP